MQKSSSHKTKHFFALLIKLFIVIGCGCFMYLKLVENDQLSFLDFHKKLIEIDLFSLKNTLLLVLFSFLNWFSEINKWKLLANQVQKTSLKEATIQSLASLTVSLITPNRIGEYGAKALYFKKTNRKQVLVLNLIGNLSQLLTTVVFGIVGIFFFYPTFNIAFSAKPIVIFIVFSTGLLFLLLFLYKKGFSFKGHSLTSLGNFISKIPNITTIRIGLFSIVRYVIFSHQFYFLLLLFHVEITYLEALISIFTMYLLASIIPMLSIFDAVIKGSIAIWVFSFFGSNDLSILSIVLIMWLLNFVIPSIVGSYFVLTFNTTKLITPKE